MADNKVINEKSTLENVVAELREENAKLQEQLNQANKVAQESNDKFDKIARIYNVIVGAYLDGKL